MTAAAVSAVGYLAAGIIGFYTNSKLALLGTPFTLLVLFIVVMLAGRREAKKA